MARGTWQPYWWHEIAPAQRGRRPEVRFSFDAEQASALAHELAEVRDSTELGLLPFLLDELLNRLSFDADYLKGR